MWVERANKIRDCVHLGVLMTLQGIEKDLSSVVGLPVEPTIAPDAPPRSGPTAIPLGVPNPSTIDEGRDAQDWLNNMTAPEGRPSRGGTSTPSTNLRAVPGGKSNNRNSDVTGIPEDKAKRMPLGDVTPTPSDRKLDPPKGFSAPPTGGTATRPSASARPSPADQSNNNNSDITGPGLGRPGAARTDGVPTARSNPSVSADGIIVDVAPVGRSEDLSDVRKKVLDLREPKF